MEMKFYKCAHCGQIIAKVEDKNIPVICCGEPMKEIVPGSVDAAQEKHVPVYEVVGNIVNVTVGSVAHPMQDAQKEPGPRCRAKGLLRNGRGRRGRCSICLLQSSRTLEGLIGQQYRKKGRCSL